MVLVMLIALYARALLEILYPYNQNSRLFLPGLPDPSTAMSCGSLVYVYTLCEGDPKFSEGLLCNCEAMTWEVFSLPYIIAVL